MIGAARILVAIGCLLAAQPVWAEDPIRDDGAPVVSGDPGFQAPAEPAAIPAPPAPQPLPVPTDPFGLALWQRLDNGNAQAIGPVRIKAARLFQAYAARTFTPVWYEGDSLQSAPSRRADLLLEALSAADREGLDRRSYAVDELRRRWTAQTPAERADLDLLLTEMLLTYTGHLRNGRVPPRSVALDYWYRPVEPVPAVLIADALAAPDLTAFLAGFAPRNPVYQGLREQLRHYRTIEAAGGWPAVAVGQKLTPGVRDRAVRSVRLRLAAVGEAEAAPKQPDLYDPPLRAAVGRFQELHGLTSDGVIGAATLDELNVPVGDRIRTILANLERARWLPDGLGERHILVNIPNFRLQVVEHGHTTVSMAVVVGTPKRKTPLFSSAIDNVVLNPTWTVPTKLAREDFLPKLRQDPSYLTSRNIRLYSNWSSGAAEIDPTKVDWNSIGHSAMAGFKLRQAPGTKNALGRIKFNMDNPFDVYLHDTPDQKKFQSPVRAFSSGCVRVSEPMRLAESVFAETPAWDEARRKAAIDSGQTRYINLESPLPVHLVYLTAWRDEQGGLQFRRDIYGWDALLDSVIQRQLDRETAVAGTPQPRGS